MNAAKRENDGQGETARQPRNTEAQGRKIAGFSRGFAFCAESFGGGDTADEAEVRAMTTRSRETTATFSRVFALAEVDQPLPAGTYRVVVDEEDIPGLSFLAFRRNATMLCLPALSASGGVHEMVRVDPHEFAAALEADGVLA